MWRAIRYGLSGELHRLRRAASRSRRARGSSALIEWVAPVADEIGAAPYLAVPAANAAERQLARCRRARASSRSTPSRCRQVSASAEQDGRHRPEAAGTSGSEARRRRRRRRAAARPPRAVARHIARADRRVDRASCSRSSRRCLAGYGKLEQRRARRGTRRDRRDRALVPVLEGRSSPTLNRDFEQALANLQVAYADASAKAPRPELVIHNPPAPKPSALDFVRGER